MAKSSAVYLDEQQRDAIRRLSRSWLWRSELPTWLVIVTVYGGWFGTLAHWKMLGLLPTTALLILFTTWYLSVQHELIHGHPTRWAWFNQLLGVMPLAVWYPYGIYRDSHLAHHRTHLLTLPEDDPESYYFSTQHWHHLTRWQRKLIQLRNTFAGRLLLAPALDIAHLLAGMVAAFRVRQGKTMLMWLVHGALLVVTFAWISHCDFSVIWFVLAVSYPALAITKVRSFLEHRAADDPLARSVINEAAWPWRLLFLNLNYHSVHHDLPAVPWYGLRTVYLRDKAAYQQRNSGFLVRGYSEWLRQFFFTPVEVNAHPASKVRSE
ncbi:fatty acid desaturase [Kosakonia sacchari]|uniref:fatty acid desaturase n=1 Tax=Kosakonia sacchari TaxID=1158459 RepID=UPI000BE4E8EA|nr:fatty acid desaturase [Kosakonia sacchari]PDO87718.1 fatty acid desaturase [Kosakonia sacchari]